MMSQKVSIVWIMSSLIQIEKGLYSSSHFVNKQAKDVAKNVKNYLIKASSNQNLKGMSEQELLQNLEDVEQAMQRNYENAEHQQLLRGILKNIQSELSNCKTKNQNEPTTQN